MKNETIKLFFKYTIPGVIAMLVTSLYFVIDGIFIGNSVGGDGLAAVSMTGPLIAFSFAFNIMIAAGSATIAAIQLGKGEENEASKTFSFFLIVVVVFSASLSVISIAFTPQLANLLGATGHLKIILIEYIRVIMFFNVFFMGTYFLEIYVRTSGRPNYSMGCLVFGGLLNILLDYIFIFKLGFGLKGAALATGISQFIASTLLIISFFRADSKIRLVKPTFSKELLFRGIGNGTSEFVSEFSLGFIIFIFNFVIIREVGSIGVSAFSIINYINGMVFCVVLGVAQGIQPLISYNLGANNKPIIKDVFKLAIKSVLIIGILSFIMMFFFSRSIVSAFSSDSELLNFTTRAAKIYCFAYFLNGVNVVISAYFTAIENAKLSAFISLLRGFIFVSLGVLLLPYFLGITGIWFTMPLAELLTAFVAYKYVKKCKILNF